MVVHNIETVSQFKETIAKNEVVIIDAFATLCGPCKAIEDLDSLHQVSDEFDAGIFPSKGCPLLAQWEELARRAQLKRSRNQRIQQELQLDYHPAGRLGALLGGSSPYLKQISFLYFRPPQHCSGIQDGNYMSWVISFRFRPWGSGMASSHEIAQETFWQCAAHSDVL